MDNQAQIDICRAPDYTQYNEAHLKRNPQSFCKVCERWQFKRQRCELFVEGVQDK